MGRSGAVFAGRVVGPVGADEDLAVQVEAERGAAGSFAGRAQALLGLIALLDGPVHCLQHALVFAGSRQTSRIQELETKGRTLTAQDVAGFKQAIAYGDVKPLGTDVDLTKLDLAVGTNPFLTRCAGTFLS